MDRAAQTTAAGSVRHQRGLRDLSLIPYRIDFDDLRSLEFSHLNTSLAPMLPAGCTAAGSSLWFCSNSAQTIMVEFEWVLYKGTEEPLCSSIDSIRSNLVPCRTLDAHQQPLCYAETQLCFGAMLMWLPWEREVLNAARAAAPLAAAQRQLARW